MKLVATLGATKAEHVHSYSVGEQIYHTYFSFEALKKHYDIGDDGVVILGTAKTKDAHSEKLKNYRFIQIDENSLEDVFKATLDEVDSDTLVDLTQSFRSISFGAFLALGFSKTLKKQAKDIYYAQIENPQSNPSRESCSFHFVSLKIYDEIVDMARIINTFLETLLVLDELSIKDEKFAEHKRLLATLSKAIYSNNFKKAEEVTKELKQKLELLQIDFLKPHLDGLKRELSKIDECYASKHESERLLAWSRYLLQKDILLHSIAVLYESMVAFLDEEINDENCKYFTDKHGRKKERDTYKRRNCLKKSLKKCLSKTIPECDKFEKMLSKVDELRNISAHAFTSDDSEKDIASVVNETIKFLENYYPKRFSNKSGSDKLSAYFSER